MRMARNIRRLAGGVVSAHQRLRRGALRVRVGAEAWWKNSTVAVDISPGARLGRRVRVRVGTGITSTLEVGPHSNLGDDVEILLSGGDLHLGPWVNVRPRVVFMVSGTIRIEGPAALNWGTVLHCDGLIHIAPRAGIGEYTTIVDSVHYFSDRDTWIVDNIRVGEVRLEENTWIGAKATITRNVTVGESSVVAAGSLVLDDVPSFSVVSGNPAVLVKRLEPRTAPSQGSDRPSSL